MKYFIIIVAAVIGLAYYTKPAFVDHQVKIYRIANDAEISSADAAALPQWDELEFLDWNVLTATQDKKRQTLVSFGLFNYSRVIDTDWGKKAFGKATSIDGEKR